MSLTKLHYVPPGLMAFECGGNEMIMIDSARLLPLTRLLDSSLPLLCLSKPISPAISPHQLSFPLSVYRQKERTR